MESQYPDYGVTTKSSSYTPFPYSSSMSESFDFDSSNWPFYPDTLFGYNDAQIDTLSSNSSLDYNHHHHHLHQSGADDDRDVRHALQELETQLMAADSDEEEVITSDLFLSEFHFKKLRMDSPSGHSGPPAGLKQLLVACARALNDNRLFEFEVLVEHARPAVSISGDPIQRLGAYMLEGLTARKESSGNNIYRALTRKEPDNKELLSYINTLYEVCPFWKFSYMAANGAIADACKNEDRIHIVDFQIAQGRQWITLLQALAGRPGGAPRVRLTIIDDPVSKYARGDGLAAMGERFAAISKKFNISVEFNAVLVFAPNVTPQMLDVRPNEALVVNFPLQLHHTPDESVDQSNPRDGLLRMVKSLSPKIVTLVEQEANTNTAAFLPRFIETMDFYSALFDSIDASTPRDSRERINMEQHCLARDIVNVIACEGKERVERHEVLGKWRSRFMMAGFEQVGLSSYVNAVIRGLLKSYSEHYTLVEMDGATLLGWKDRSLISASAWQ